MPAFHSAWRTALRKSWRISRCTLDVLSAGSSVNALSRAAPCDAGWIGVPVVRTVRQDLTVRTTGTPIHPASHGAARLSALTDDPALNTSSVHLLMRQDFLNAVLHALWNAGMLEGKVMAGGLAANVTARLPPVVRPTPASSECKIDGERCDVQLQLGQVEIDLLGQGFGINASA